MKKDHVITFRLSDEEYKKICYLHGIISKYSMYEYVSFSNTCRSAIILGANELTEYLEKCGVISDYEQRNAKENR